MKIRQRGNSLCLISTSTCRLVRKSNNINNNAFGKLGQKRIEVWGTLLGEKWTVQKSIDRGALEKKHELMAINVKSNVTNYLTWFCRDNLKKQRKKWGTLMPPRKSKSTGNLRRETIKKLNVKSVAVKCSYRDLFQKPNYLKFNWLLCKNIAPRYPRNVTST